MRPSIAQTLWTPATPTWEAFLATSYGRQHPSCPPVLSFLFLSAVYNPGLLLFICCYFSPLECKPLATKDLVCLRRTGSVSPGTT